MLGFSLFFVFSALFGLCLAFLVYFLGLDCLFFCEKLFAGFFSFLKSLRGFVFCDFFATFFSGLRHWFEARILFSFLFRF